MLLTSLGELGGRWEGRGDRRPREKATRAARGLSAPCKTHKTLQCCHLQAQTFKAYSVNSVFALPLTMKTTKTKKIQNCWSNPEPQIQNPVKG